MYYKPDDGFDMRKLTDEQEADYLDNLRWSRRYGLLSFVCVIAAIYIMFRGRWGWALCVWILANISSMAATYFRQKAKEAGL